METSLISRFKNSWNVFWNRDPTNIYRPDLGPSSYSRPDRARYARGNDRTIATAIFNRIAIDVSSIAIKHCQLDDDGRFKYERSSNLNTCLTLDANVDQTGRAMIQDTVHSMLDEGVIAMVPTDVDRDPNTTETLDILSMRTGKIVEWYPNKVKLNIYNENLGRRQDVILPKRMVAIVENPLYAVINEPNSTMQRLFRKLSLLDITDEQTASGKLDLIIQLPYVIKTDARRQQADQRRRDIEMQLAGSKYGIAYTDGTEKITQLNRPVENNLMKQVEYLTETLYSQLGITKSVLDGTADEQTMLNYHTRTIEPIISAIVDEMNRKFLTKTARTQGQRIMFFREPFKLVPVNSMAEIADKFTRNEIMTSNEVRQVIGMKPSDDPKADQLINSNISQPTDKPVEPEEKVQENIEEGGIQNG